MSSFVNSSGSAGRRGSFLDHVDMSPSLKSLAADLLTKNARDVKSRKAKSTAARSKISSRRKRYNIRGKRGTISMAEFKEMNKGVLTSSSRASSSRKNRGTEVKFKPFRFTNGTSSRLNRAFLYLSEPNKKPAAPSLTSSIVGANKQKVNRKAKLLPSAYRVTKDQRHAFFRAEQRHEVLMKPWRFSRKQKCTRDTGRVTTKWLGRSLSRKLIDSLEKTNRGHLYDVLEVANECAFLKVQNLKAATVGNDYVQQLVDGVIYYTGEPSVLHNRAEKAQKTAKNLIKSPSSYDKNGDNSIKNDPVRGNEDVVRATHFPEEIKQTAVGESKVEYANDVDVDYGDESDGGSNAENSDDANNETFIENDDIEENGSTPIDSPSNDIEFDDDVDLHISSIKADNEENDNGDEVLQLAIKTSTGSGENNMEFDEQTMSWKAVGEKAQKEEEELMAGFDSDESDDDDDEDWG